MATDKVLRSKMRPVVVPERDLYSIVYDVIKDLGTKTAMHDVQTDEVVTFAELLRQVELVAGGLVQLGFTRGSTLVLYCGNYLEYPVMVLAALRLGGMFASMNHLLTSGDVHRYVGLCDGDVMFTCKELVSAAVQGCQGTKVKAIICRGGTHPGCISFASLLEKERDQPKLPSLSSLDISPKHHPAAILFSSGTTGLPKAVMLSHYNLAASRANSIDHGLALDRCLYVPFAHIGGIGSILFNVGNGRCLYLMRSFDLDVLLATAAKHKLERMSLVPPVAVRIAKLPHIERYDLSSVKQVICAAAPLSAETEKELYEKCNSPDMRVVQLYGLTETTGAITCSFPDTTYKDVGLPATPPGSAGALVPNVEAMVVDVKTRMPLGPNQDGELLFRSPQNMLGYQKNPEATAEAIDDQRWLKTGDIGHYDENEYFFIVDRLKELIKYKGNQVSPSELEALILTHPAVADCGVIGLPELEAGELPHAWVVLQQGATATETDLMQFVAGKVAPYKKLRGGVKFVENIPKSPTGKILRREMKTAMTSKL